MFVQSETDFPRGKKKKDVIYEKKTLHKDDDLFQTHIQQSQQRRGTKRKKNKLEKDGKKKKYDWEPLELNAIHIESLNFSSLCPGMLVLGCVKRVEDYSLVVDLPGGHRASIDVSSISDAFTKVLQQMSESEEKLKNLSEDVSSFHDMFYTGMLLRCKILQVVQQENGKRVINLTINPKEIYEYLSLETLKNKMILTATVISHEDHGYQMDIGVANVQAFLTNKAASKFVTLVNKGQPLVIGQYMHCMINMPGPKGCSVSDSRIVKLVIDPNQISQALEAEAELKALHYLYPGMLVSATITEVTVKGLLVSFFSFRGFIHKSHLRSVNEIPENYSVGDEVLGCLLYIYPITNIVSLSLVPHLCQPDFGPLNKFHKLSIGDHLENGKIFVINDTGIYLKFKNFIGFVQKSHLSDKPVSKPSEEFSLGQIFKCRVINFNYLDQLVILSMRESIINEQFFNFDDIKVGDFVEGEVKKINIGMNVKITRNIFGFIPHLHLADVPLIHPHKKFKEGDQVKCRVLLVDAEKRRLLLTCKKSLLHKNVTVLSSLENLHHNTIIEGVIVCFKSNGLIVKFFNDVAGWVSRKEMSDDTISIPENLFYLGQVVKCRVLNVIPERKKLFLSLRISERSHPILKNLHQYKELIGQIVDCTVVKKINQGLDVILLSTNTPAFIPKKYLSDHISHSKLLWQLHEEGDIIKNCLCFDAASTIILTKKNLLIESEKNELIVSNFDEIKAGLTLTGVVGNIKEIGIFVQFPYGLVGLAPRKLIANEFLEKTSGVFEYGHTVVAKIIEINKEKKRFLVGLRLRDCYNGDIEVGLDYLQAFLEEKQNIQHSFSKKDDDMGILCQVAVGSLVMVKITQIDHHGIVCETTSGVQGLVLAKHICGFDGKVGDEVFAAVLFVDLENKRLELSLDKNLMKQIKNRNVNESSKAAVNQKMKANIILIKDNFILVSLALHAKGILAYMPAKRNCNDYLGKERFSLGMNLPVIIKRVVDNSVLVTIQAKKRPDENQLDNVMNKSLKNHNLNLNEIQEATIKNKKPLGLIIEINGFPGFVHISRIKDKMSKNENIMKDLKKGQNVQVRILKIQNFKQIKAITTKYNSSSALLCTMKESDLSAPMENSCISELEISPNLIGHQISAFFCKFTFNGMLMQVNLNVNGILDILDFSLDLGTLKNIQKFIKPHFCYKPMVREIGNNYLILTLTGLMDIEANKKVCAQVIEVLDTSKLVVRLSCGYKGEAALVNLADNYDNVKDVMEGLHPGMLIQVYILSSNKTEHKAAISIRPSRLCGPKHLEIKDPEVNLLQDLQVGQLLRGFIKNLTVAGLFISLGNGLDSFVPLSHIQKPTASKNLKQNFSIGQLVTTKIISVSAESNEIISSLVPEERTPS